MLVARIAVVALVCAVIGTGVVQSAGAQPQVRPAPDRCLDADCPMAPASVDGCPFSIPPAARAQRPDC